MIQTLTAPIAFIAGVVSIFSPCVLPLLPAIVSASTNQGKLRPLAIVIGLMISFTVMGVLAGAFGMVFTQFQYYLYAVSIALITFMGVYMLFDLHIPLTRTTKHLNIFNKISYHTYSLPTEGVLAGLALGLALGVVWLPCVGPVLGTILTWVAADANIAAGAWMLFIYSLGFTLPMLGIAYSTTLSSGLIGNKTIWIKRFSGFVLLVVGVYMAFPYLQV